MLKWATIIYGRTYEVDFRLLVKPHDFNEETTEWAKDHILVAVRSEEELLKGRQRWTIFQNDNYRIVGVTCMASDLSVDMNADRVGRPLYTFVGFVCRQTDNSIFLPAMNIELFKGVYGKYVRPRWLEKDRQTREFETRAISNYEEELETILEQEIGELRFNVDKDKVSLWPDSEEWRQQLWNAATQQQKPFSLCLGLARQKDAVEKRSLSNVFLNVTTNDTLEQTTVDVKKRQEKPKEVKREPEPIEIKEEISAEDTDVQDSESFTEENESAEGRRTWDKVVKFMNTGSVRGPFSGTVGGATAGLITKGLLGVSVGGVVGGVVGSVAGVTYGSAVAGILGGAAGGIVGGPLGIVTGATIGGLSSVLISSLEEKQNEEEISSSDEDKSSFRKPYSTSTVGFQPKKKDQPPKSHYSKKLGFQPKKDQDK
ncbi:MAG: hypothetical protein BWK78_01990 [Thiotrichaceae bacterium IS1]|nr:MAG: hypothetical protein BWK78_01990 [Thiotrichaceae bacterium IS1]